MKYVIAICAGTSGFGPASKAAAVGKRLEETGDVQSVILADGTAHEFLRREGFFSFGPVNLRRPIDLLMIKKKILQHIDAAIVALDYMWTKFFVYHKIPVFFIDSLGFHWTAERFERNRSLLIFT